MRLRGADRGDAGGGRDREEELPLQPVQRLVDGAALLLRDGGPQQEDRAGIGQHRVHRDVVEHLAELRVAVGDQHGGADAAALDR